jgi:hypothetical protein
MEALTAEQIADLENAARRRVKRRLMPRRFVYFAHAAALGFVKIGVTADIYDRMKTLQVGCPDDLRLIGVIVAESADEADTIEGRLHHEWRTARARGEWFRAEPELLAYVSTAAVDYHQEMSGYVLAALRQAHPERVIAASRGIA